MDGHSFPHFQWWCSFLMHVVLCSNKTHHFQQITSYFAFLFSFSCNKNIFEMFLFDIFNIFKEENTLFPMSDRKKSQIDLEVTFESICLSLHEINDEQKRESY